MSAAEMNPCPSCGGENLVLDHYSVGCVDCMYSGPANTDEEIALFGGYNEKCYDAAIEKWNRRAREPEQVANGAQHGQPATGLCKVDD